MSTDARLPNLSAGSAAVDQYAEESKLLNALQEMDVEERSELVPEQTTIAKEEFEKFAADYEADDSLHYIDPATGQVIPKDKLTHWQKIVAICNKMKVNITEPKKGCRRCMGRGYIAIDSAAKTPIPCSCIFVDKANVAAAQKSLTGTKFNRATKRKLSKVALRRMKMLRAAQQNEDQIELVAKRKLTLRRKKRVAHRLAKANRRINAHQRKSS